MKIKRKIYLYKSGIILLPFKVLEKVNIKAGKNLIKINNFQLMATTSFDRRLRSGGSIDIIAKLIIPKKICRFLKLKHKQEVDLELENEK